MYKKTWLPAQAGVTHLNACLSVRYGASLGETDCNVFRVYSPWPSPRLPGTTQPGRGTIPTQGSPGTTRVDPRAACRPLRHEPKPPARCGHSGRQCMSSALAHQQGCTVACRVEDIVTSSRRTAATPPAVSIVRDGLGLAPAPSLTLATLSDSMVSNVESAAQSSIGQCS